MTPAIRTFGLTRRYGDVTAVDGLELTVSTGEVYAFLGLNGAGKSTTIRMLLGMVRPSAGRAEVLGVAIAAGGGGPWDRVGCLVESASAYPDLSVRENLEVARRLTGAGDRRVTDEVMDRLRLDRYADRRAGTLSTGNLQRLALARALLHAPELLILDEPSTGLDPAGVAEVRALIRGLAVDRGATVFMSSHILSEVDRLATRVGVIHDGRLVAELGADELDRRRHRRLEVGVRDPAAAAAVLRAHGHDPVGAPDAAGGPLLVLAGDEAAAAPDAIAALLAAAGHPPTRLVVTRDDMETFFLSLTGGSS